MLKYFKRYSLNSVFLNLLVFVFLIFINIFFDLRKYPFSLSRLYLYIIFAFSIIFSIIIINKTIQVLKLSSSFSLIFSYFFIFIQFLCQFSEYRIYLTLIILTMISFIQIQLIRKDNVYLYLILGILVGLAFLLYNYFLFMSISVFVFIIILNSKINKNLILYILGIFVIFIFSYEINIIVKNDLKIPSFFFPRKDIIQNIPIFYFIFILSIFFIAYIQLMSKYNRLDNEKRIFTVLLNFQIFSFVPIIFFDSFQNSVLLLSFPFSFLLGDFFLSHSNKNSFFKSLFFIIFQVVILSYLFYKFS